MKSKKLSVSSPSKAQPKIGVVIDRLNVGGVEKIAIEQVKALRALGEDAHLVILREKAVVEGAFADLLDGVPITYLDQRLPKLFKLSFSFPIFHFFSSFHLTYPILLPFVVKTSEFDYFIAHSTYTCLSLVTLKKFRKINFSAFIWDPSSYILERVYSKNVFKPLFWLLKKLTLMVDTFLINRMDTVLVGGDAHNTFIKNVNPAKPIKVIYPSVHPVKKPAKKQDFVLIATAWKQGKYPEYLVELVKAMPEIKLKMVGKWLDPEYRTWFETLLKENDIKQQIEIVGGVSEAELTDHYSKALVVLQTNDDRGFGMPALEAAGHATTFIIPRGQGVCKLFKDKEDGFYTKEKDTTAIVALLRQLMKDQKLAARMGENGWQKVKANYSWAKHAESLQQLIN